LDRECARKSALYKNQFDLLTERRSGQRTTSPINPKPPSMTKCIWSILQSIRNYVNPRGELLGVYRPITRAHFSGNTARQDDLATSRHAYPPGNPPSICRLGKYLTDAALIKSTVYLVGNVIYNIYFHPLAGVPGPKWAAASQVPIALVSWRGGLTYWLRDLHEKYDSDTVRVSPHEVSFISPSAWKDIYGRHQGQKPFQKDLVLYGDIKDIVTANDADHARMRRSLNHGFSEKALREQEPLIQSYVDTLFSQIRIRVQDDGDRPVNLTDWFNWFTMDLISDLSFGESFDCLHKPEWHPYIRAIELALRHVMLVGQAKRFSVVAWFLRRCVPRNATKARSEFLE
ncbi:MAG: hypothetical protein Q9187_008830, partial [Circinaria calcarea]